jgi:hypothetical protein
VDDISEELIQRALGEIGEQPLPPAVAARLDARLAAELDSSPLAARRARRGRLRIGASLSAAAAVAAAVVFALSTGGGTEPQQASAVRDTVAAASAADSAAVKPEAATTGQFKIQAPTRKQCAPASRKAGDRPPAGCPGARGGRARAV